MHHNGNNHYSLLNNVKSTNKDSVVMPSSGTLPPVGGAPAVGSVDDCARTSILHSHKPTLVWISRNDLSLFPFSFIYLPFKKLFKGYFALRLPFFLVFLYFFLVFHFSFRYFFVSIIDKKKMAGTMGRCLVRLNYLHRVPATAPYPLYLLHHLLPLSSLPFLATMPNLKSVCNRWWCSLLPYWRGLHRVRQEATWNEWCCTL